MSRSIALPRDAGGPVMTQGTKSIGRRQALVLLGAGVGAMRYGSAAASMLPMTDLSFAVSRSGDDIGTHTVTFERQDNRLMVRSAADFAVRFGPIVVYRYTYRAQELWQDGILQTVSGRTDDDGTTDFVEAERRGDRLFVTGSKCDPYLAPPGALAATHWNKAELDNPMINPQNGELMHFAQRDLGPERLSSGIVGRHFTLSGYAALDIWYDEAGTWRALRGAVSDGSVINYRPQRGL